MKLLIVMAIIIFSGILLGALWISAEPDEESEIEAWIKEHDRIERAKKGDLFDE